MKSLLKQLELWWILFRNPSLKTSCIQIMECDKQNQRAVVALLTREHIDYAGDTYALTMLLEVQLTQSGVDVDCMGFEWQCVGYGKNILPLYMTPELDRKTELILYVYMELLGVETVADIIHLCQFELPD